MKAVPPSRLQRYLKKSVRDRSLTRDGVTPHFRLCCLFQRSHAYVSKVEAFGVLRRFIVTLTDFSLAVAIVRC